MIVDFVDDDEGTNKSYLKWVKDHPDGFVLNVPWQKDTIKLHSANCWSIQRDDEHYVGPDYYKKCSMDKSELVDWANQQPGPFEGCRQPACENVAAVG